ncbi:MAG: cation transporter, partial [Phenylobacterium sp.]|nr:cation transporter [Phenylobacterium sp.]
MAHDHTDPHHGPHHGHAHSHDHGHDHGHDHAHGLGGHHHHAPKDFGRAFAVGVILNTGFVAAEVAAGLWFGSLALLADAGHNLSDVMSLLLAWGAVGLAKRKPSGRRT